MGLIVISNTLEIIGETGPWKCIIYTAEIFFKHIKTDNKNLFSTLIKEDTKKFLSYIFEIFENVFNSLRKLTTKEQIWFF